MNITGQREPWDTPCRGVCTATALGDEVCRGCGRTLDEVLRWNSMSREERTEINKRLRNQHDGQAR